MQRGKQAVPSPGHKSMTPLRLSAAKRWQAYYEVHGCGASGSGASTSNLPPTSMTCSRRSSFSARVGTAANATGPIASPGYTCS